MLLLSGQGSGPALQTQPPFPRASQVCAKGRSRKPDSSQQQRNYFDPQFFQLIPKMEEKGMITYHPLTLNNVFLSS